MSLIRFLANAFVFVSVFSCAVATLGQTTSSLSALDTQLVSAVQSKNVALTKMLLHQGANVNTIAPGDPKSFPRHRWPVLMIAAGNGDLPTVKFLLAAGAQVDARSEHDVRAGTKTAHVAFGEIEGFCDGGTALLAAAWRGQAQVVPLLLQKGADVNARDSGDWTPLMYAAAGLFCGASNQMPAFNRHCQEILKLLLDHGADVNAHDKNNNTALLIANTPEVTALLLDRGADIEAKASNGWNTLIYAGAGGKAEIVKLLLARGADVNANAATHNTALRWAVANHQPAIVAILKQAGAKE